MGYKQPSYLQQTWWVIKYAFRHWLEWQDAKAWVKQYRPAWVEYATKCRYSSTRKYYRKKILEEYRSISKDVGDKNGV